MGEEQVYDCKYVTGLISITVLLGGLCLFFLSGCSSLPEVHRQAYAFPRGKAFLGKEDPGRPYVRLGMVKARADYVTLDAEADEQRLCKNYFNKAVKDLVRYAKENGGDAVIEVHSVTYLMDGKAETLPRAECTDDGEGGQALVQGVAVKWKTTELETGSSDEFVPAQKATRGRSGKRNFQEGFTPEQPAPRPSRPEPRQEIQSNLQSTESTASMTSQTQSQVVPSAAPRRMALQRSGIADESGDLGADQHPRIRGSGFRALRPNRNAIVDDDADFIPE